MATKLFVVWVVYLLLRGKDVNVAGELKVTSKPAKR
jgi:hypothetical protein